MDINNRNEKLANDIIKFLKKNNFDLDVHLLYNGKMVNATTGESKEIVSAGDYVDYFNDDTITMTFEGPFYEFINGYWDSSVGNKYQKLYDEFDNIFKKYGLFYDLGDNWNLSAYEL